MAVTQSSSLVRGPLVQHFKTLAIPAAIGMGFSTLYNLVDVFFAGMISTQAQAGLAVSFHPFFLLSTFAFGLGTAMSALVGNALGANKRRRARKIALQGIGYGIIGAFVLLIIGFVFAGPLMTLTTEPGEIRTLGSRYFLVLLFSLPGFILSFSANGILQAFGDAESFKRGLIGAFLANIVLDPLFVFGIPGHWGGIGFDGLFGDDANWRGRILAAQDLTNGHHRSPKTVRAPPVVDHHSGNLCPVHPGQHRNVCLGIFRVCCPVLSARIWRDDAGGIRRGASN